MAGKSLLTKRELKRIIENSQVIKDFSNVEILGKGKTSIFFKDTSTNKYYLLTLDDVKSDLLTHYLVIGKVVEEYQDIEINGFYPILLEVKKLNKVDGRKKEIKEFIRDLENLAYMWYRFKNYSSDKNYIELLETLEDLRQKYENNLYIIKFTEFLQDYLEIGYWDIIKFDVCPQNILMDDKGNLIPYDVLISRDVLNKVINNSIRSYL